MQDTASSSSSADESSATMASEHFTSGADVQRSAHRWPTSGVVFAVLGGWLAFTVMARAGNWAWSVPVGFAGCLISAWGILDALGTFDDLQGDAAPSVRLTQMLSRLGILAAAAVGFVLALRWSVAGVMPWPRLSAAVVVTAGFLATVLSAFGVLSRLGIWNASHTRLTERHGFWLLVLTTVVYLPMLGSYSLIDPWETHYGEVAREMLARDDWISLWWAQDGWFFSKPVLDFWIQGLSFSVLGVRFMPDEMIASSANNYFPQPEWAARLPVFLMALGGAYLAYRGAAAAFGRRAAFLGSVVLLTTPYWAFLSHQSMTDMPYVAPLAAGLGLLLLGFRTDPEALARRYPVQVGSRTFQLSAFHVVFGLVSLLVLAQVLYLVSRNVTFQVDAPPRGYIVHSDLFWSGSGGGNCGLPGNAACERYQATWRFPQPWQSAVLWTAAAGILLFVKRRERRLQRLYFLGFWLCVALSAMAKGAPGIILPVAAVATFLVATKRWSEVWRLELVTGVLLMAAVALPWFVQMYLRHGSMFTDRLLLHDMYKRAFTHVHDTNSGDDVTFRYYIWQLGYGLFPWSGLAVASLLWWLRGEAKTTSSTRDATALLGLWFVLGFSMFTVSLTKFHHYVLPVVPAVALLTGWLLDRLMKSGSSFQLGFGRRWWSLLPLTFGAAGIVDGLSRCFPGSIFGNVASNGPPSATPLLGAGLLVMGVVLVVAAGRVVSRTGQAGCTEPRATHAQLAPVLVAVIAVVTMIPAGRDLWATFDKKLVGAMRLLQLFTYNYGRPWPDTLDFRAVLIAFTIAAAAALVLLAVPRFRGQATVGICVVSVLWCAWTLNVYLIRTAPHWGQRETIMAYYRDRSGPEQPLVAFQMNWKGENFYTGNRVPAFVTSGDKFKDWVSEQRSSGVRTMYFSTEHSRAGSLRRELGDPSDFQILTTKALNNKFMVARVRFQGAEEVAPSQ